MLSRTYLLFLTVAKHLKLSFHCAARTALHTLTRRKTKMAESPVVTKLKGTVKSFSSRNFGSVAQISITITPEGGGADISFSEQDNGYSFKTGDKVDYSRVATSKSAFYTLARNV